MEYIKIGKILNTHGIKGELKVDAYTDFIQERFKKNSTIYIGEEHLPFVVKTCRDHKGFVLIQLKDNEDINLVERFKNLFIYKDSNDIKPLNNGEYYFRDLKNLNVYKNNELIGQVINVEEGNRYNYLRIKVNDEQKLVPFIKPFILNVDLDKKRIDVLDMEGLL